jgi:IMP dehydrogenase/GMP reductase
LENADKNRKKYRDEEKERKRKLAKSIVDKLTSKADQEAAKKSAGSKVGESEVDNVKQTSTENKTLPQNLTQVKQIRQEDRKHKVNFVFEVVGGTASAMAGVRRSTTASLGMIDGKGHLSRIWRMELAR